MLNIFDQTKFVPTYFAETIYEIPYEQMYKQGITHLVFDLDNTLAIPSDESPSEEIISLFTELSKTFEICIVSNNRNKRVDTYSRILNVPSFSFFLKPFQYKFRKNLAHYPKTQTLFIGNQRSTDILGANTFGFQSLLVDSLKNDKKEWYSVINRCIEYIVFRYTAYDSKAKKQKRKHRR